MHLHVTGPMQRVSGTTAKSVAFRTLSVERVLELCGTPVLAREDTAIHICALTAAECLVMLKCAGGGGPNSLSLRCNRCRGACECLFSPRGRSEPDFRCAGCWHSLVSARSISGFSDAAYVFGAIRD